MNLRFRPFSCLKRCGVLAIVASLAGLAGCHHESVVPVPVVDYFPVVVGTYRTYAVADSSWAGGVATVSTYQFRERVTEQFTDAAGQLAYRVVRSKRLTSAATWVDDSVLVVQPLTQTVLLTRNNVRTVELVYPIRAGKTWNAFAFTVNTQATGVPDSITNLNRVYGAGAGQAYTTPAAGGQAAKSYDAAVTTLGTLPSGQPDVNALYQRGLQQVYARGVGLVLRRRFSYYTYTTSSNGATNLTPGVVQAGASRRETLIDSGTI